MRREPPSSEVTEVFEAHGSDGSDYRGDNDDRTVPIRTPGPDAAVPPDHETPPPEGQPPDTQAAESQAAESQAAESQPGRGAAGLFAAVTAAPALVAAAWLLPGLPLLLTGRLAAPPLVLMFSPLAVGLCYLALRQPPTSWPGFSIRHGVTTPLAPPARGTRKTVPWWAVAATAAIAVGFAAWQIAERTEQLIVVRDPATYLQVGDWIAHHGSLPIPQQAEAFGGLHQGLSFASLNYYPSGSGLVPQLMAGLPLVLAAAIWLGGVPAALVITPLIGACAVLSFGGLVGRLIGVRWAPAAAAALALSLPEQYTSRGTFSEPLTQVLLFGGLCLLIDALVLKPQRADGWFSQDRVLAALAGLVLGLVVLVRIDGLSDVLPAVPFLGLLLAARRRQGIPFALGLAAGVGYGLGAGYLMSRPYLDQEGPSLRPLGLIVAAVAVATLAGYAAVRSGPVRARLRRLEPAARWLPLAAAAVTVAMFGGFAVRPLLPHASGQYDQNSLYWVIWYIGLPVVLLGAFGLAAQSRNSARALLTWTDPRAEARTWALPLLVSLWVIATVLWRPAIIPEQPWASSRLVPFVLPGLILGAVWASAWLRELAGQRGQARTTSGVVASCCTVALLVPATLTNLDLGYTSGPDRHFTARGLAFQRIGAGELATVNRLCTAIGPDASVVILDALTADQFAQVSRGLCDTPTAIIDHPTAASVRAAVTGVQHAGRRPVLLARSGTELAPYGGGPRPVVDLQTTQEARDLTAPPTRTWPIQYAVWMSNPT